jgi:hypothetical protein
MRENPGMVHWKKEIRLYGMIIGICLVLAAGINALMEQGQQDPGESESLRSLKSELEQYRKDHGDKTNREDLIRIWKSYEGKLSAEDMERLKREYRGKLDAAEVEGLKRAYEETKGRKP